MSTAYIFRLKRDTTAVSIFSVPFWLFHLGGCKNLGIHVSLGLHGLHAVLSSC